MIQYTTPDPYFPENLQDFAPWVAQYGLRAPYGSCQCGCGRVTSITKLTNAAREHTAGFPVRFVTGHRVHFVDRFWANVIPSGQNECWEWQGHRDEDGYGSLSIFGKNRKAHRVSFSLVNGYLPDDLMVCHHCDNPPCCNPAHLFIGTAADNSHDRQQKGRFPTGEKHGNSKLTYADVRQIRQMRQTGMSYREIAERFQVGKSTIGYIVNGQGWKHV